MAFQLAQNWIRTNYDVYSRTSAMYEKVSLGLCGDCGGTWWPCSGTAGLSYSQGETFQVAFKCRSCPQYNILNGGQPGGGGEYEVQVSELVSCQLGPYREAPLFSPCPWVPLYAW